MPSCPDTRGGPLQPLLAEFFEHACTGRSLGGTVLWGAEGREVSRRHGRAALGYEPAKRRVGRARRSKARHLTPALGHHEALAFLDFGQVAREMLTKLPHADDLTHVRHGSTFAPTRGSTRWGPCQVLTALAFGAASESERLAANAPPVRPEGEPAPSPGGRLHPCASSSEPAPRSDSFRGFPEVRLACL